MRQFFHRCFVLVLRTAFVALVFATPPLSVSASDLTYPDTAKNINWAKRITRDASNMNLSGISARLGSNWILATIHWQSVEGFGLVPTDSGDHKTLTTPKGRVLAIPIDKYISVLLGTFSTLTSLQGKTLPYNEYNIERPRRTLSRANSDVRDESQQTFTPFDVGGTFIFQYQEQEKGLGFEKYNPTYVIPDEWANFVLPAFKFQQANKSLFDDKNVAKNQKRLLELTSDANPFNAVVAARVLAPARGLDAKFVKGHIAQTAGYQQAIFTYLAFKNAHPLQQESIDTALRQIVNNATSSAALKWITLGITTAQNDDASSYFALKDRVKAILLRVDKKQKELKTTTPDDDYVNELLISAQVRERPVTPVGKTSNF